MKDYKSILTEIKANADEAARLDNAAEELLKTRERQAAARAEEYTKIKDLYNSITEQDKAEAAQLYTRAEELRSVNKILAENARASFAEYVKPIISGIMQQYNGKQYGEKTSEKIRAAANAAGIGFYFSGYLDGKNKVTAYALTDQGYINHSMKDINLYARDAAGKQAFFISASNKIQDISDITIGHRYKYTEAPADRRAEIEKAYKDYCDAIEAAQAAETAINNLLPDGIDKYRIVNYSSPYKNF